LGAGLLIVTPAFPENGRTVFKGHLFVGDVLLSDSPMRHHPLTPMTDANLVRVLQAQMPARVPAQMPTQAPAQMPAATVGLIDHRALAGGVDALRARMATLQANGVRFAIADAVTDADLHLLAQATANDALVVAGSGLAIGIPALHGLQASAQAAQLPVARGHAAIVSGSCSSATQAQVQDFIDRGGAAWALDPLTLVRGRSGLADALAWAQPRLGAQPVLIYSTANPATVGAVQAQLGVAQAGVEVERALALITVGLVAAGVGRLVVAGGETSGACVRALGPTQLRIGPQIDPGVPWCHATWPLPSGQVQGLHLALKSGNFGAPDFFSRAFALLQ
jgi:3-dehydrotetronate 4-kinase